MRISIEYKQAEQYHCVQFTSATLSHCIGLSREELLTLIKEAQEALDDEVECLDAEPI
jgi:hypothetical protein